MEFRNISRHSILTCASYLFVASMSVAPSAYAEEVSLPQLFSPISGGEQEVKQRQALPSSSIKRSRDMTLRSDILKGVERISINLFADTVVDVELVKATQNSEGRTAWRGKVINKTVDGVKQESRGSVTLIINDKAVTGTVRIDGKLYEIEYRDSAVHTIREIDTQSFPTDHPAELTLGHVPGAERNQHLSKSFSADVNDADINVLVLYTPAVAAEHSDMAAFVDLAIDETNQSYQNSGLNKNIQLTLTSAVEVDYTEVEYNDMLAALRSPVDNELDEIHSIRYQNEADVVVLLVKQSGFCGLGYLDADYELAFTVVNHTCATGNYSFAHEIGHVVGARHDVSNDTSSGGFDYAHGYQSPTQAFRTIMAYQCEEESCPRVDYWSNPDVEFGTESMGDVQSDNAQVWEVNSARLANLHETYTPPDFTRDIGVFHVEEKVYSSPLIDSDNNVYFADHGGNIYGLNSAMSMRWKTTVSHAISSSLVLEAGVIFYRTASESGREFGAIDSSNGDLLWSKVITGGGGSPGVDEDGTSYIMDGTTLRIFSITGEQINSVDINHFSATAPTKDEDGTLYIPTTDGVLRAFSPSLESTWTWEMPASYVRTCMAISAEGVLYLPAQNGVLYAVDNNGNLLWNRSYDTENTTRCPVIDFSGNVIMSAAGNVIQAISAEGDLVWESAALNTTISSTPAIASNGDILVSTWSRIYSLSSSGDQQWYSHIGYNFISSVSISNEGVAYIGDSKTGASGLRAYQVEGLALGNTVWPRHQGSMGGTSRAKPFENTVPSVVIDSPTDGAIFLIADGAITLQATANDLDDGIISEQVVWTSDIDGTLLSPVLLTIGQHVIKATITDSHGGSDEDSVTVTVMEAFSDLAVSLKGVEETDIDSISATIENIGSIQSINSSIAITLPEGVTFVSAEEASNCTEIDLTVSCDIADISPNESVVVIFKASPGEGTPAKHSYKVEVFADNDGIVDNNTSTSKFGGSLSLIGILLLSGFGVYRRYKLR